jgi:hypothetical protein
MSLGWGEVQMVLQEFLPTAVCVPLSRELPEPTAVPLWIAENSARLNVVNGSRDVAVHAFDFAILVTNTLYSQCELFPLISASNVTRSDVRRSCGLA